jgi:TolB-like protein
MPEANQSGYSSELSAIQVQSIRRELELIVSSNGFAGSKRCQEFLRLIVERTLAGQFDLLRERMIGVEMFGRQVDYDTSNDAVVRVRATEVRKRLAQYYAELDGTSAVRIELPAGSYVPRFSWERAEGIPELQPGSKSAATAENVAAQPRTDQSETNHPTSERRLIAGIGLCLIVLAAIAYFNRQRLLPSGAGRIQSIVVLPLENLSGDPKQDYFADAMTEELTVDLGQVSALRVISRTSAMMYKNTKKSLPDIARELRVDGVVEGSVVREGNEAKITAQLIDATSDRHIWARTYTRGLGSVLTLQREVAQEIADAIRVELSPLEKERLRRSGSVDIEAQDLYLLGVHLLDVGDPQHALDYLQKAVEKDPGFAQAYAALSHTYSLVGGDGLIPYVEAFSKAKASALRAIELDEGLSDGHLALADAVANLDWDWGTQEKELKRALELNPSGASAHWAYAFALEKLGRTQEAMAQLKIMQQLDPVSSRSMAEAVEAHYYAHQYDVSMDLLRRLDAANPQRILLHFWFGVVYREKGLYQDSVKAFMNLGDHPHALGHMGNAYARWGKEAEARAIIPRLQEHIRKNGIGTYEVGLVYAGLGEKDSAFEWLEKASVVRDKGLTFLKIDPCLDPLRSDPRFQDLLRRVGLPL